MTTQRQILRSAQGVVLTKLELVNAGTVVDTAYLLQTLRTPETWNFSSLAEADAAYLKEVGLSETDDLVAKRLGKGPR
jgi:hypothetical protein